MIRRVFHGSAEYDKVVALRDLVLRKPLGLSYTAEQLAAEKDEVIFAEFDGDQVVASMQYVEVSSSTWKMRQVATHPDHQGSGRGTKLIQCTESFARARGVGAFVLHAREAAVQFYLKNGYEVFDEPFVEVGIPHRKMRKKLHERIDRLDIRLRFPEDTHGGRAVLPIGALEWHGSHLPLGLDELVAKRFGEELALCWDAVMFPVLNIPITTLPHVYSFDFKTNLAKSVWRRTLECLNSAGFSQVAIVSGHYAQGHELELYDVASEFGTSVLAASPLEVLEDDNLLDHAGRWEAACFEWFFPGRSRLSSLVEGGAKETAVLGESPSKADSFEGWAVMATAMNRWIELLASPAEVPKFYDRRREAYRTYHEQFYKTSWEQAISDWWATK